MRVLLVDDHPLFLEGFKYLLEAHGVEVAGTARNGQQAVEQARALHPDLVLLDIEMPGSSGLDAILPIKRELPQTKIVMLTSFDEDDKLFEAVKRGAVGYLLKNLNAEQLFALLRNLEAGDAALSPGLAARVLRGFTEQASRQELRASATGQAEKLGGVASKLTERQKEVLDLVAQGMPYKQVAAALGLSERTVKYHMERILELLGLESRAQAVAYVARERTDPESR